MQMGGQNRVGKVELEISENGSARAQLRLQDPSQRSIGIG